ncbi:hypothetical protein [Ideonella sp.]|uniref:hypothetical protein n=1 Tax=Ideonella sp. TaxID=1929293 RepID=UPI002B47C7F7|nr:hypothetical protein [Ideonella sp.]HJV68285.1 hypothetical protein [Ideonella sp.]
MKVVIIGDSHTAQLHRGIQALQAEDAPALHGQEWIVRPLGGGHLLPFPFFRARADHIAITQPEYRKNIHRLPLKSHPDARWHGVSGALHTARVFRHADWARHALPGMDGPGIPVSGSLLGRLVDDDQRHVMALLIAMQSLGMNPFVIEGPRPFRHHPAIPTVGAHRVIAIDSFFRERMKGWLAAKRIPVAELPQDVFDEDGFMRDELRNRLDDPHHGNAAFGRRMILEAARVIATADAR